MVNMKRSIFGLSFLLVCVSANSNADQYINKYIQVSKTPGCTFAVGKNGQVVYAKGYGKASSTQNVEPWHIFKIASMSKAVTALAIMQLIENKKLSLDTKIWGPSGIFSNYLPRLDRNVLSINVRRLLTHTSCLAPRNLDPVTNPEMNLRLARQFGGGSPATDDALFKAQMFSRLTCLPGSKFEYSNLAFHFLGSIIEKKSGKSYEEYIRQMLSEVGVHEIYPGVNGKHYSTETETVADGPQQMRNFYGGISPSTKYLPMGYINAAGGLAATARGIVQMMEAVKAGLIISTKNLAMMTKPTGLDKRLGTGMAWENTSEGYYKSGALPGAFAYGGVLKSGQSWAVMCNKGFSQVQQAEQFMRDGAIKAAQLF